MSGLVGFAASMVASYMVGLMSDYKGNFIGLTVTQFQLIFLISGLLIIATSALIRFTILKPETKKKEYKAVLFKSICQVWEVTISINECYNIVY